MKPVTSADKLACAERELIFRNNVYPRRVRAHLMSRDEADRQIAIMQAIIEDYRAAVERDQGTERLL